MKIVTIGGGSSYTPELADGLIRRASTLGVAEYWLVDIPEGQQKQEINAALIRRMAAKAGVPMQVHATLDRARALEGADFVTTQLRVGGLKARELDERIPMTHGVVGQETNGAGGLFKALRTIPVMLDIAAQMRRLCPDAWLINFTNPSGIVTEALHRYGNFPRSVGLCNVPINMERKAAAALGVEQDRVRVDFAGLNHMVYGTRVLCDGRDVTAEVLEKCFDPAQGAQLKSVIPVPFEMDFIRSLGVMPCPYHYYYYKSAQTLRHQLEEFAQGESRATRVMEIEKKLFEVYANPDLEEKPRELEDRGGAYYSEAACRLIESIHTDRRDIQPVDTLNRGAIPGIDHDSVVEVSCVITADGPVPLQTGGLPVAVRGLVQQIKSFERLAVEAACECDRSKALLALCINPLIPDDALAKTLLDEMMEAHREYLPGFFADAGKISA